MLDIPVPVIRVMLRSNRVMSRTTLHRSIMMTSCANRVPWPCDMGIIYAIGNETTIAAIFLHMDLDLDLYGEMKYPNPSRHVRITPTASWISCYRIDDSFPSINKAGQELSLTRNHSHVLPFMNSTLTSLPTPLTFRRSSFSKLYSLVNKMLT